LNSLVAFNSLNFERSLRQLKLTYNFTLQVLLFSTGLRFIIRIHLHQLLHLPLVLPPNHYLLLLAIDQFIPIFLNLIHKLLLKTNLPLLHTIYSYFLHSNSFHHLLSDQSRVYFPRFCYHVVEILKELRMIKSYTFLVGIHKIVIALHKITVVIENLQSYLKQTVFLFKSAAFNRRQTKKSI